MKREIGIIAFDDGPHLKTDLTKSYSKNHHNSRPKVPIVGVVCRGRELIHVSKDFIEVDGFDATSTIIHMVNNNKYKTQLRLILIDGPTLAGFNVVDPFRIHGETNLPVILLPDDKPKSHIKYTFQRVFPERVEQQAWLEKLPPLETLTLTLNQDENITGEIFFHLIGITLGEIKDLFNHLSEYSALPEPLRLAHIIASAKEPDKTKLRENEGF